MPSDLSSPFDSSLELDFASAKNVSKRPSGSRSAGQKRPHSVFNETKEKRYCICQSFYREGSCMISCDGTCKNWYHPECIGMSVAKAERMEGQQWFC